MQQAMGIPPHIERPILQDLFPSLLERPVFQPAGGQGSRLPIPGTLPDRGSRRRPFRGDQRVSIRSNSFYRFNQYSTVRGITLQHWGDQRGLVRASTGNNLWLFRGDPQGPPRRPLPDQSNTLQHSGDQRIIVQETWQFRVDQPVRRYSNPNSILRFTQFARPAPPGSGRLLRAPLNTGRPTAARYRSRPLPALLDLDPVTQRESVRFDELLREMEDSEIQTHISLEGWVSDVNKILVTTPGSPAITELHLFPTPPQSPLLSKSSKSCQSGYFLHK